MKLRCVRFRAKFHFPPNRNVTGMPLLFTQNVVGRLPRLKSSDSVMALAVLGDLFCL